MAALTTAQRSNLPDSAFALVFNDAQGNKQRMFPIYDRVHATQALRMAQRSVSAGTITRAQYTTVIAAARKALGYNS